MTKDFVGRTRPKEGDGYSFPSGHMMYASFFYGYLLYILFRSLKKETQKKWKKPLLACYFLLLAGIGWSRIYLKDHFATDILGGTALGLAWLLIAILVTEWLEKKAQHRKAADPQKSMNAKRA
nr:phosphatase PAP2 family protein [Metabacillus kandeliae]